MTDLGLLNSDVTRAILEMEKAAANYTAKCLMVALAEANLAHALPSTSVEGEVAMRGTIRALLKADHKELALKRVVEYLKEDLRPEVRAQLEAMRILAEMKEEL
jgi:hypothetical protein